MSRNKKPVIILYDIETSFLNLNVESFSLKTQDYQSHKSIVDDWNIISIAWKKLGSKKIDAVSVLDDMAAFKKDSRNDLVIIKRFAKVMHECDILVGHNSKSFDTKKFNARLIYHGLPPIDLPYQVDTLKEARKIASFTSNRLDYLAQHLGFEGKIESEGLWKRINKGKSNEDAIKAIQKMIKYNKQDVNILEYVYLYLRPYMTGHTNLNIFNTAARLEGKPAPIVCGACGSKDLTKNGIRPTISGIKQKYICKSCGHTTSIPMSLVKKSETDGK